MPNSWGHSIRLLTGDEVLGYAQQGWTCTGKCTEKATHATTYRYITGRQGRVARAERAACDEHARRFAAKHSLELPTEATPGQPTATQAAVRQMLVGDATTSPSPTTAQTPDDQRGRP